jgi:2-oxoglutarate dehydrogenase E2 component (dihydrolipoamide succinyltransferase)
MSSQITVPTLGESITEATVARWLKKIGDPVARDEPLVELETDKVTLEVSADVSGTLNEITVAEGGTIQVGGLLGVIGEPIANVPHTAGKTVIATPPDPDPAPAPPTPPPAPPPPAAPAAMMLDRSGPAARKLVAEHGLEAAAIPASGKDGRITKGDVLDALAKPQPAAAKPATPRAENPREQRVPMTRLRKRIAERLKAAQNSAAMLTTFNEVDMTAILALRETHRDAFEKRHGVKLGFMSFFVKAAIAALRQLPAVNAEIDGDDIVYKNYYDIGVAVGTESGLVVPVVRDADLLGFAQIEQKIAEYGKRARDGKLALDDLSGGTFTISNGGVYGSLLSTPILNPPQSAILGMHKTQKRPVVIGDDIVARPMMYLALSYDHRVIDGREAVTFLVHLKASLEDPSRLLFDL